MKDAAPVCLVSMPFMPVTTPALGVSLLKAGLSRAGIDCDIFYGSLRLLDAFHRAAEASAVLDYSLIASTRNVGDVFFADSLWVDAPLPEPVLAARLKEAATSARDPAAALARFMARHADASRFIEDCLAARDWSRYRVVGFSSTFAQQVASLALAGRIKRDYPHVTIVFGGANCDGAMGRALLATFPFIDHVVQGEADTSFPDYVAAVLRGSGDVVMPGVLRRSPDGSIQGHEPRPVTAVDELPLPDFSDFFAQRPEALRLGQVSLAIESSRGCWWGAKSHCTFCGLNPQTMAYRSKRPERTLAEIDALTGRWGLKRVVAVDNIIDVRYFKDVLPALAGRELDLFYETKSNLKEWQVRALARAGVRHIQPGIESLSTGLLALMRKGVRRHQNLELLKWCRTHKVAPLWFYLYGFPGEDPADYRADAALMRQIAHLAPPKGLNPVVLDRYSPLFGEAARDGNRPLRPTLDYRIAYHTLPDATVSDLAYHFDDGAAEGVPPYIATLRQAFVAWRQAHRRGAALIRLCGDAVTLIVDTRAPGVIAAFVLTGTWHRVHAAMHVASSPTRLQSAHDAPDDAWSSRDLALTLAAGALDAVACGDDGEGTATVIAGLIAHGLAIPSDGLILALATDPADLDELAAVGLEELALHFLVDVEDPMPELSRTPASVETTAA